MLVEREGMLRWNTPQRLGETRRTWADRKRFPRFGRPLRGRTVGSGPSGTGEHDGSRGTALPVRRNDIFCSPNTRSTEAIAVV